MRQRQDADAGTVRWATSAKIASRSTSRGVTVDGVNGGVNVLAFGLPGTGKTLALCALGHRHRLVEAGHSVLFAPAYRLVRALLAGLPSAAWTCSAGCAAVSLGIHRPFVLTNRPLLIAERYERRSLGITSNLVFSEWELIFANPMAAAATIDRVVRHSVILEFDVPSYRTNAAQQRGQAEEANRHNVVALLGLGPRRAGRA